MKDRLIAAGAVMLFFLTLRTNANPEMWQIGLIAVALYESVLLIIKTFERETKKTIRKREVARNVRFRKEDGYRLEDEVFDPLRRMREVSNL